MWLASLSVFSLHRSISRSQVITSSVVQTSTPFLRPNKASRACNPFCRGWTPEGWGGTISDGVQDAMNLESGNPATFASLLPAFANVWLPRSTFAAQPKIGAYKRWNLLTHPLRYNPPTAGQKQPMWTNDSLPQSSTEATRYVSVLPHHCREATVRRRTFAGPSKPTPRCRSHKRLSSAARHYHHLGPDLQWDLLARRDTMPTSHPCCRLLPVADPSCSAKFACCHRLAAGLRWSPYFYFCPGGV